MAKPKNQLDQASEELRKAVRDGLSNHTGEFVNPWIFRKYYSHEELTDMLDDIMAGERLFKNLQSLIRTEKLKLLAEVRERVIGEGELVDAEILKKFYDKAYSNGYNDRGYENSYNSHDYRSAEDIAPIMAKIRGGYEKRFAALTKLEAEL